MHLFRAFSDQSHGMNTTQLIAPGAAQLVSSPSRYIAPDFTETGIGDKLLNELGWKKDEPSIFTNWTPSLQLAILVAQYRMREKDTNVQIICIEISEARNLLGAVAKFHSVPSLIALHGLEVRKCADDTPFNYDDVFVTLDCVVPGENTRVTRFETLEREGLYSLYPGMEDYYAWNNRRSKLNVTLQSRRKFYRSVRHCTAGAVNIAAKVAATFLPTRNAKLESIALNILGAIIALQKRPCNDGVLCNWLNKHATELVNLEDDARQDDAFPAIVRKVPDIEQYLELWPMLANKIIKTTALSEVAGISEAEKSAALQEWKTWSCAERVQWRAEKPRRPDFGSKARKRPYHDQQDVSHSGHGEGKQTDHLERRQGRHSQGRRVGRRKKDWVPREEYHRERAKNAGFEFNGARPGNLGFAMPGFESSVFQTECQEEQRPRKKAKNVIVLD